MPSPPSFRRELRELLVVAQKLGQERSSEFRATRCAGPRPPPAMPTFRRGALQTVNLGLAPIQRLHVIQQGLRQGFDQPWSLADVLHVLAALPAALRRSLKFLILRQPTQREEAADACYFSAFFHRGREGPAIVLNAVPAEPCNTRFWDDGALDLAIARRLGARIGPRGACRHVSFPRDVARAFLLYHVLLHEIGHLNDENGDHDREEYAERFAVEWELCLRRAGVIPFNFIADAPAPSPWRRSGWSARMHARCQCGLRRIGPADDEFER